MVREVVLRRGKAYQDYPCRMNEIYTIYSDRGDEYRLQFTTERSGIIANVLLDQLAHDGIEVVEIGLARVKGSGVTGHKVLGQIVVVLCQKTALGNYVKRYCNPSLCNQLILRWKYDK